MHLATRQMFTAYSVPVARGVVEAVTVGKGGIKGIPSQNRAVHYHPCFHESSSSAVRFVLPQVSPTGATGPRNVRIGHTIIWCN